MTVREIYDYLLSATNKVEAPSLLLETFNHLHGQAINGTCNQWYTFFEQNQLLTDNLRVLTRTVTLQRANTSVGNFYKLPADYWHLLPNSIVTLTKVGEPNCKPTIQYPAIKTNSQMNSGIFRDYYTKPSYKRPYLYMHENVIDGVKYEIEIKSGLDDIYRPTTLQIDYLKKPELPNKTIKDTNSQNLYLTFDELDSDTDISAHMEFPENYCYEIVNKLTALVLELTGDIRLQSGLQLNQTMIPPKQG